MNENKTAFEQYMEKIIGMVLENPASDEADLLANRYRNILSEYRRLESSQAEKDKGVVEEFNGFADWLDKAATRIGLERMDYYSKVTYEKIAGKIREILSRHEKGAN